MNEKLLELNPTVEFKVKIAKTFSVTIKAWVYSGKWNWNVYANIFESHELFNDPKKAYESLPFNGGCTYDRLVSYTPSGADTYNDRSSKTLTLGSDYAHIHDDYDNHPSPFESIPYKVMNDVNELVEALGGGK